MTDKEYIQQLEDDITVLLERVRILESKEADVIRDEGWDDEDMVVAFVAGAVIF